MNPARAVWNALRRDLTPSVFMRDGSRCTQCGTDRNLSVDHVVPLARGGTHSLANLRTLCVPCNSRKGAR